MGDEDHEEPTAPTSKEQVEMNKLNNAIAALTPKEMDTASVAKVMELITSQMHELHHRIFLLYLSHDITSNSLNPHLPPLLHLDDESFER
jgi:hypothetical protein